MSSPRKPRPTSPARAAGPDDRAESMLAAVRASGLKLTPQRIAIVRELATDPKHPTAQELFERLRAAQPTMSFATVYNTLDALAAAGLCAALSLAPGPSRFDPNMKAHHHAVCDRCGLVRDVPCDEDGARPAPAALSVAPGFEVRAVEQIYRGLCAACAQLASGDKARRGAVRPAPRAQQSYGAPGPANEQGETRWPPSSSLEPRPTRT